MRKESPSSKPGNSRKATRGREKMDEKRSEKIIEDERKRWRGGGEGERKKER